MSETDLGQTEPPNPVGGNVTEPGLGFLHVEEKQMPTPGASVGTTTTDSRLATPIPSQAMERAGTIEHLAARRPIPELDANMPEIKQRLSELRTEVTRLVTGLRWGGQSVEATAESMIPLLNIGPVQQWRPVLIPFLLEIDRAGNLIPVWLKIIERAEPHDLPPDANPADTTEGRAKRFAILMLGNYKSPDLSEANKSVGFFKPSAGNVKSPEFMKVLGRLAVDPNTSLYATQALVQQGTAEAIQILVSTLKNAEGWAKVDIVESCLALNQPRFHELLVASGLDHAPGLESYLAIPLYRAIPLEDYLRGGNDVAPRLSQQAALIFSQVLQDSMMPPGAGMSTLPVVLDRHLPTMANALFEGARSTPTWQHTMAVHRLGLFLGRYWSEVSRGTLQDPHIVEPVYVSLPMMPDIERWMEGPGRDVLLDALTGTDEEAFSPAVKVLGELRDPRATSALIAHLEAVKQLTGRKQALSLSTVCETLGRLGDRRAVHPMLQLVSRVINVSRRTSLPKRRDNLSAGDADIPGSIVYAAVIRACGQLGDRGALDTVLLASADFDPYVRVQAIEALKRIDPSSDDLRSRIAAREALNDPRDTIIRTACQLVLQYRDNDAVSSLRRIIETRPDLAPVAYDTLRQLGQ